MKVGWLCDPTNTADIGGAQLSTNVLRRGAPDTVEVVDLAIEHPESWPEVDIFVIQNCTLLTPEALPKLAGQPILKFVRDMWVNGDNVVREWLLENATAFIFLSPGHLRTFEAIWLKIKQPTYLCPSSVDLYKFQPYALNLARKGVLWLGPMYPHKGVLEACAWAEQNQTHVDFYGPGPTRPRKSPYVTDHPQVEYDMVPELMGRYEQFLYVPPAYEPFGRTVLEARAAGLRLLVNHNIGALWWMENAFEELLHVEETFWRQVRVVYRAAQQQREVAGVNHNVDSYSESSRSSG